MILKDVYLRYNVLNGKRARYVPSWDAHGLPIERAVGEVPPDQFKQACETMIQRHRLGMGQCMGALKLSFDPACTREYSTHMLAHYRRCWHLLRKLYLGGKVIRGSGFVHSCPTCRTNLTNSEVQYRKIDTAYAGFSFEIVGGPHKGAFLKVETTVPWTIGLNEGVGYNPAMTYGIYTEGDRRCISAVQGGTLLLKDTVYRRPDGREGHLHQAAFIDERGTGLVHLAPVVGEVDNSVLEAERPNLGPDLTYEWNGVPVSPKNHPFRPQYVKPTVHRSGLCYRCGGPVTHRRTGVETYLDLKDPVIKERGRQVHFVVEGWRQNFLDWLDNLKDRWCISRPRKFAIPLNVYCSQDEWFVADVDGTGPDATASNGRTLPPSIVKQGRTWLLDGATFDVWFQSAALVKESAPFTLMMEGKDQIRGFFANCHILSSLCYGRPAAFKILVTPYVNQRPGVKLSKSAGAGLRVRPFGPLDVNTYRLYLLNHGWTDLVFDPDHAPGLSHWLSTLTHLEKFLQGLGEARYEPAALVLGNQWLCSKYVRTQQAYFKYMDLFRHDEALRQLRRFTVDVLSRTFINGFKDLLKFAGKPGAVTASKILRQVRVLLAPFVGEFSKFERMVVKVHIGDAWLQVPKGTRPHQTLFTEIEFTDPREQFLALHRAKVERILHGPTGWEGPLPSRPFGDSWTLIQAEEPWVNGGSLGLPHLTGSRSLSEGEIKIAFNVGALKRQLDLLIYDRDVFTLDEAQYASKKILEKKIKGALKALTTPRVMTLKEQTFNPQLPSWHHRFPHWETSTFLIVCGKNASRSAELSRKVGPQWYVFHAEGPGGSVFLKSQTEDAFSKAAALAVLHSDNWRRGVSGKVGVTFQKVCNVRFKTSLERKKCLLMFTDPRHMDVSMADLTRVKLRISDGRVSYGQQGFDLRPGVQSIDDVRKKLGKPYSADYLSVVWPSHVCI